MQIYPKHLPKLAEIRKNFAQMFSSLQKFTKIHINLTQTQAKNAAQILRKLDQLIKKVAQSSKTDSFFQRIRVTSV